MHTPAEIGFWHDPRILGFSAEVKNPDAGAWILRLREFVLCHGSDDGRLPGYPVEQILAVMRPSCSPRRLLSAAKKHGILRCRRNTWFVPGWKTSVAGRYCAIRKWERERKEERRLAAHQAALEQLNGNGTGPGQDRDRTGTDPGKSRSINIGRSRDKPGTPPGAPRRGADEGASRWGWFSQNYLKISAPEKCQRLLGRLTPEEWEHLQFSVPRQMAKYRGERGTKFCPGAVAYLADKRFLEIRMPEKDRRQEAEKARKPEKRKTEKQLQAEIRSHALTQLMELLNDPHPPAHLKPEQWERQKVKAKEQWQKVWGDRPWEKGKG